MQIQRANANDELPLDKVCRNRTKNCPCKKLLGLIECVSYKKLLLMYSSNSH